MLRVLFAASFYLMSASLAAGTFELSDPANEIYEEKYGAGDSHKDTVERDLSALGEVLESRFVLEDRLIAGLHQRHRRLVNDQVPPST